ncbi:MAG: serine/threonine protein kinase, partial [Candidatus Xenobia bacterium]
MLTAPSQIGPYQVLGCLGQGGMGAVYRVRDENGQAVALKLMSLADRSAFSQARFEREFKVLQRLCHPNLVRVLSYACQGEYPYYTMELVEGKPLLDHAAFASPPGTELCGAATPQVLHILQQLLSALDYIHRNGLVHRDIKPENIICTRDGIVKLVDFGLVRDAAQSRLSQSGTIVGTLDYLAPEQAMGREVDRRSDLYSMGVLLYRICTGVLPLEAADVAQQIIKIISEKPPPAHQRNPTLPDAWGALIGELLEKEPAARPSCAAEVWERITTASGVDLDSRWECGQPTGVTQLFTPQFVGRERELRALEELLTPGRTLEIGGPEGIGKSRLADQVMRECRRDGWKVLHVRFADQDQRTFPALASILAQTGLDAAMEGAALLAPYVPGSAARTSPAHPPDQLSLFNVVLRLLRQWAGEARVLFVGDDWQWIDGDSTALLGFLRDRLLAARWTWLTVVRDASPSAVVVSPLSAAEVESLVASTLGDAAAAARLA